ncbi:MAG TPA: aromatic ring-hydroxylating dioxygenase subunit alpha [Candidatus Tumulicola sp.]
MKTFVKPGNVAGAMTLDASWYVSPDVYARERQTVFGRQWLCVGRDEHVAQTGDFITVPVGNDELIVTRDRDGEVRAFFNVCRHRGTKMCEVSSGRFTGSIQCPYHAWTYGLDGKLLAARNMADVEGFDRSDYPLRQAAVARWEGFLFVNLAESPEPFERAMPALSGRFDPWQIGTLTTARTIHYDVACNWKLIFQNYSECYHCPLVHPQLDRLSPSDSGRNDCTDGLVLGGYSELRNRGASLTTSGHTNRQPIGTVSGDDLDRIYYYTIFPSMLLSLHPDYVMVHYIKPVSIDRTHIVCAWMFDSAAIETCDFDPRDAVEFWDLTNRQDWHVSELTQQGLRSRAYSPGPYSNAEGLLAAFDRQYLAIVQAP